MEKNYLKNETVLVVGATGLLGMEICTQLRHAGQTVKALVRPSSSPEKVRILKDLGAEIVTGDIKDLSSLQAAFNGASAVISTATSTMSRQEGDSIETVDQQGQLNVIEAALHAGTKKFVFISVYKTNYESPLETAKRTVEIVLKETGMRYTILQPTVFMEVWLSPFLGMNYPNAEATIYGEGTNKLTWIAIKDVAAFAVASLDHPAAENATIPLGGPQALTPLEVVALFQKHNGKSFQINLVPVEALKGQYATAADPMSKSFAALMLAYAEGNEINMEHAMKEFQLSLTTVEEYTNKVMAPQKTEAVNA
jgi:uncharacterized protein YbjT (DUF2867 family)